MNDRVINITEGALCLLFMHVCNGVIVYTAAAGVLQCGGDKVCDLYKMWVTCINSESPLVSECFPQAPFPTLDLPEVGKGFSECELCSTIVSKCKTFRLKRVFFRCNM